MISNRVAIPDELSISISGGKENNNDFPNNCEKLEYNGHTEKARIKGSEELVEVMLHFISFHNVILNRVGITD
ncbi:hypothetical protein RclHR1_01070019 [Rhizophagus clarus]|uniref:Uncharacterized protein n=1 Tax=Rhizophagus clarus TaxID=94130 RepID=A0A2Z6QED3_9GLOM|nr:hypothetical protein RclHR1_01070019 [Rhizophagus clarus]